MKSVIMEYTAIGNHMLMGKAVGKHEAQKGRSNEDETWTLAKSCEEEVFDECNHLNG
jgi:hypothetical protein